MVREQLKTHGDANEEHRSGPNILKVGANEIRADWESVSRTQTGNGMCEDKE